MSAAADQPAALSDRTPGLLAVPPSCQLRGQSNAERSGGASWSSGSMLAEECSALLQPDCGNSAVQSIISRRMDELDRAMHFSTVESMRAVGKEENDCARAGGWGGAVLPGLSLWRLSPHPPCPRPFLTLCWGRLNPLLGAASKQCMHLPASPRAGRCCLLPAACFVLLQLHIAAAD